MTDVKKYWDDRFVSHLYHHVRQNCQISKDFLEKIPASGKMMDILSSCESMIEIGCGTGQLCSQMKYSFPSLRTVTGVDISDTCIQACNFMYHGSGMNFIASDCSSDISPLGFYDLSVCSNMLEHFSNPFPLIDTMLANSCYCLILVPYKHEVDKFENNGGEGHCFVFSELSFKNYKIEASVRFDTNGWQSSGHGEIPTQYAVILKGKLDK